MRTKDPWKLYFLIDAEEFEADFVIARTMVGAKRCMSAMYGGEMRYSTAEEVATVPDGVIARSQRASMWLGPEHPILKEIGGKRLRPTRAGFPRWKFGDRVVSYAKSAAHRYGRTVNVEPPAEPLVLPSPLVSH